MPFQDRHSISGRWGVLKEMKKSRLILILILALVLGYGSYGAGEQKDVEIGELIIDQTRSRMGHEFYRTFVTLWEAPPGVQEYNIVMGEQNDPRLGSWVAVEINNIVVYRGLLKPSSEDIAAAADEALEITRDYLLNLEEYEKSLEEEDLKGKGIY